MEPASHLIEQRSMTVQPIESKYLAPAEFVDSDHPAIIAYATDIAGASRSETDRILNLFYAVRDDIYYDPYLPMGKKKSYRASDCLRSRRGWCVSKAALLTACARTQGVPARCGYADVRNHLATPRLLESLGTDVFYWHSYCELYLEGQWVKATPTFNKSLCDKFGIRPLDFDGRNDALFHEYDREGKRHMEYIRFRGSYADVPFAKILETFARQYKESEKELQEGLGGDFEAEAGQA
jgi:transglutaminase-like putative cysteine protease